MISTEVFQNVVDKLGDMINKNSEAIFALKTELKAAEEQIKHLKHQVQFIQDPIQTIENIIAEWKNKKPCPRCKGEGSVTFRDYAGKERHEPCPYCLSKRTV